MLDAPTAQDVTFGILPDGTCTPSPDKHPPVQGIEDPVGNLNPAAQLASEAQDAFSDNLVRFERDRSSSSGTLTATIGQSTPASNRSGTLEYVPHSGGLSKEWKLPPRVRVTPSDSTYLHSLSSPPSFGCFSPGFRTTDSMDYSQLEAANQKQAHLESGRRRSTQAYPRHGHAAVGPLRPRPKCPLL